MKPNKDPAVARRKKTQNTTTRPVNLGSLVFQDIARDHSSEVLEIPDRHASINHRSSRHPLTPAEVRYLDPKNKYLKFTKAQEVFGCLWWLIRFSASLYSSSAEMRNPKVTALRHFHISERIIPYQLGSGFLRSSKLDFPRDRLKRLKHQNWTTNLVVFCLQQEKHLEVLYLVRALTISTKTRKSSMKLVMCRLEYWEHIQCESFSSSMFDSEYFRRRVSNSFKSHDAWEWFMFNTCCQRAQSNTKTMEHNSTNQLSIVPAFALTVWHSKVHIHCILPSRPFKPSQKAVFHPWNLHDGTQLGVWPQLGRH